MLAHGPSSSRNGAKRGAYGDVAPDKRVAPGDDAFTGGDMNGTEKFLKDPMGPRRWALTGVCFAAGGSLVYLLRPQSRTSVAFIGVGALVALAGVAVEVIVRLWLRASARGERR